MNYTKVKLPDIQVKEFKNFTREEIKELFTITAEEMKE